MANPNEPQDVLTTPSVLECPICNEQYGTEYETTPRVLRCGHTYCTKCLAQLVSIHAGKRYGVKCAFCSSLHELARPDPKLIPINHAVLEIIKISDSKRVEDGVQDTGPRCEYKGIHCIVNATWVCFDCNPTTNTMFCGACIKTEHDRGFDPVTRHRRMLMAQVNNPHSASCPYHPRNCATLYSVKLQEFACADCDLRPEFAEIKEDFEPIGNVVERLRSQAKSMVQYSQDILAKLNLTLLNISANNAELGPSVEQTKSQIQAKFSEIIEIINERQLTLMKHVQTEYAGRRQGMEDQLVRIKLALSEINAAQGSLNSALGKYDVDFLLHYLPAFQGMERVLGEEDRSLQRTVSYKDIPFYIPQSITEDLRKLGAVGGGTVPYDIEVELSNDFSNMLQLKWQILHNATEVQCYEIEYEHLPNTSETGLRGSRVQSDMYHDMEPHSVMIPGNVLASYVPELCPGYKYRFRIRSQNVAGWGMWSKSVTAKCESFPLWIKGTKRIHRIRIPHDCHYRLTAKGAKGADGKVHFGGRGAIISGTFSLQGGDVLIVLVGTMSTMSVCNTGGGGGSFIAVNEITQSNLLIAAGGGGGTRGLEERDEDGCDANLDTWGTEGVGKEHGKGGAGGGPGEDANSDGFSGPCWGYGGAGFLQSSSSARSFIEGGTGGQYGGFGGGGAVGLYGGGGGGGYSGGGGGRGGGGGGSYVREDAVNVRKVVGNESHGEVEIKVVPPPSQQAHEVWSGESYMNTNAALISLSSREGCDLISQSSSDGQLVAPLSHMMQPIQQPWPHATNPPPSLTQDSTRSQAYASQFSKASSASVNSGAASVIHSYSDFPLIPEPASEVMPQSIISGKFSQQGVHDREDPLPISEEAVVQLDVTCQQGTTSNNTLLQYQPELVKSTQDTVTILPPVDNSNGMGGLTNVTSLPPQSQITTTAMHTGSSNASGELSPPQTAVSTPHPNSNAATGTA